MSDRWTSEQNIKFVELYKSLPVLWNFSDANYKKRDLRREALELIRVELELNDTSEVTKKIKNLRSTYNQEVVKIERSKQSGCEAHEIYKPTIKWFSSMDLIMKNSKEKSTSDTELLHTSLDTNHETEDTVEPPSMQQPPKRPRSTNLPAELSEMPVAANELKEMNPGSNSRINSTILSSPSPTNSGISTRINSSTSATNLGLNSGINPRINSSPSATNSGIDSRLNDSVMTGPCSVRVELEDECDVFGRHVALQLKHLPAIDRIDALDELQAILSKYRKKALGAKLVCPSSSVISQSTISDREGIEPVALVYSHYSNGIDKRHDK